MGDDVLRRFDAFTATVRQRLEQGRQVYGDRSFGAAPGVLLGEIAEELQDVCAWSYILWHRLESLRSRLGALDATAEPRPTPVAPVARMVGADRGTGGSDR